MEEPENRMRFTPLNWAVLCESEPITKLLLERGANPMASNRNGYNSLYMAALLGRADLLKLLIENGVTHSIPLDQVNLRGRPPTNLTTKRA